MERYEKLMCFPDLVQDTTDQWQNKCIIFVVIEPIIELNKYNIIQKVNGNIII